MCCVCRQDMCCVCSQDICFVSRQVICSLPRHPPGIAGGRPCVGNEEGMSWQTADLLAADTTDVSAADTTDVLPADTTHVLPADKFGVGNPTFAYYFEVLDLHLGCLVLEAHFPGTCSKNTDLFTVWEPLVVHKRIHRIKPIKRKWYMAGSSDPRFLTRLSSG